MSAPSTAQAALYPAATPGIFALMQLGSWHFGVDAALIQHARPYAQPDPLSTSTPLLSGSLTLDEQPLPAVNLEHWLAADTGDMTAAPTAGGYHVILEQAGIRLALRVDQLGGMRELPADTLASARPHAGIALLHSVTFDDGATLHLLDAAELNRQLQSVMEAAELQQQLLQRSASEEPRLLPPMGIFELEGQRYALPASLIHEVTPCPEMSTPFLWGGPLRGVAEWRGQHVYLLDPAGLGARQSRAAMLAVVGEQQGFLGLPIDAAITLRRFRQDQLSGADDGLLYAGLIVEDQASPIRLLDAAALLNLIPRTATTARQLNSDHAQQRSREAYLVCRAGIRLAIPIQLVQQVCLLPADFSLAAGPDESADGSITWRGQTLPLHALGTRPTRMLVICHDQRMLGLLVDAVETLLPALSATLPRAIRVAGQPFRVISTRDASYTLFEPEQLDFFSTH
ncbi:chemotaxis protein CheW [Duganella qianjiadongensis]|uniref:CheW-like domain-containing protein n=1 Tax=Duganella qianjiadongensis TaxID=2692176 RepID=A0ABW9VFS2_9BURK|nr:chemotaxis protein CheW [Duganella qianjiadongensis]MYM37725.1 hypothetical protein [Duganella qianjiadongensis]